MQWATPILPNQFVLNVSAADIQVFFRQAFYHDRGSKHYES